MQLQGFKPALGVIYNTTMSRPDSALALAMLQVFDMKREARIGAVAVSEAGLGAAIFCDLVTRFYTVGGPLPNSNRLLPVGLAAEGPLPPDSAMVKLAVERRDEKGEPRYARAIRRVGDTAELPALLRNAVTYQAEKNAVLILSAPATHLARSIALPGTRDLIEKRLQKLVVVDTGAPVKDPAALRKVLAEWPTPVVFCGPEVGESLKFPGSSIEKDFAWAPAHPIVDAYRSYREMPYDAPSWDLAAMYYGVHPDQFDTSGSGSIVVGDDGRLRFTPGADGPHKAVAVDPAKREALIQSFVAITSTKPVPRVNPFRPQQQAAQQQQQQQQKPPEKKAP